MIFITAQNEPTIFLLLTEADCNDMRGGRTKFVDPTATDGGSFKKIVISLHKNQGEIEEMVKQAGHGAALKGMPSPVASPQDATCEGCLGIIPEPSLLDGLCIACWRIWLDMLPPTRGETRPVSNVLKLLATGTNDALLQFTIETAMFANFFEQRKQTVHFALMKEHLEGILASANAHGITIQRIDRAGAGESYTTLHEGTLPGWSPAVAEPTREQP